MAKATGPPAREDGGVVMWSDQVFGVVPECVWKGEKGNKKNQSSKLLNVSRLPLRVHVCYGHFPDLALSPAHVQLPVPEPDVPLSQPLHIVEPSAGTATATADPGNQCLWAGQTPPQPFSLCLLLT